MVFADVGSVGGSEPVFEHPDPITALTADYRPTDAWAIARGGDSRLLGQRVSQSGLDNLLQFLLVKDLDRLAQVRGALRIAAGRDGESFLVNGEVKSDFQRSGRWGRHADGGHRAAVARAHHFHQVHSSRQTVETE
jgi:hypothetical protein